MNSTDLVKKQRQNVTYPYFASFSLHFGTPPQTTTILPTPPMGPLQPAACLWRSPLTSAARLGSVPALWASMDVAGLRNNPVCVEHTAPTQPVPLKHIQWPVNSQPACCPSLSPVNHTHHLLNETREDQWFVLRAAQENKCSPQRRSPPQIWLL